MEDVKRLSGLIQVNADRSRRDRQIPGKERLAHLRNGGRGLVADRRFYRRGRLIRSGCRQRGESYEHAERSSLERIPQYRGHAAHAYVVNRRTDGDRRSPGLQEGPPQTITDFHVDFL